MRIRVPYITKTELRNRYDRLVRRDHDNSFYPRWCVNYIRHELTDYDETLSWLKEQPVEETEAYLKYKVALLTMIGEVYPSLRTEIGNQLRDILEKLPEDRKYMARRIRNRR